MTSFVFNATDHSFTTAWESFALRTGLCLTDACCCVGPSVNIIAYEHSSTNLSLSMQLKLLAEHKFDPETKKMIDEMTNLIRIIKRNKHPSKQEIVILKQAEKVINGFFKVYNDEVIEHSKPTCLPQLAPFHYTEEKCLFLFMVEPDSGEKKWEGSLSRLLSFAPEDKEEADPGVVIFYERLGHEVSEKFACTPLATLPNMISLTTERLKDLRQRLAPLRTELDALLPALPTDEHGNTYHTGYWNLEGIKEFAPRLQKTLDTAPELEVVVNLSQAFKAQVQVGNMAITDLWQLLHTNGVVPGDSWKLLQQKQQSGIHAPTVPFITITSDWNPTALNHLSEEQSQTHKRKTLNID